jgi:hypothetical protein
MFDEAIAGQACIPQPSIAVHMNPYPGLEHETHEDFDAFG